MPGTVRVHGLKELNRAFGNIDKKARSQLGKELKQAAEPVVQSSRGKVTRYQGSSPGTIRARQSGFRVSVEQSKAKVTGQRGDFGALQMRNVLVPALAENEAQVFQRVEDTLDKWGREEGF